MIAAVPETTVTIASAISHVVSFCVSDGSAPPEPFAVPAFTSAVIVFAV